MGGPVCCIVQHGEIRCWREMCMQGRMQKWGEKGMFVSFNAENRSFFSSVNTFQILEAVYHLICASPCSFRH